MFKDDIKQVYASLKEAISWIELEKEFILFNHIDEHFTSAINDYLLINFGYDVSIDSFIDDLDDLYKSPIFDRGVDAIIDFNNYLNNIVKSIREANELLYSENYGEETTGIKTVFNTAGIMIYVDLIAKSVWPVEYDGEFKKVTYNVSKDSSDIPLLFRIANKYLSNSKRCTLVTADRIVVELMLDRNGSLYAR
jgi:hypothetical protein